MDKLKNIIIVIMLLLLISGCKPKEESTFDLESVKIEVNLIKESDYENVYMFNVTNNGGTVIKYIEVAMGFDLIGEGLPSNTNSEAVYNGVVQSPDKPVDIEDGETINFLVYIPVGIIKEELVDYDNLVISANGYFEKIDDYHQFSMSGSLESFID